MKVLFVHPGRLVYNNLWFQLEPLGLEMVAAVARRAGNAVRLVDLQIESQAEYCRVVAEWAPDFIGFSCNYLANVPEIVDLAKATKLLDPRCYVCVGGHSASFIAQAILEHGAGAIDCVLRGEGEAVIVKLLDAVAGDRDAVAKVPGAVTMDGEGPPPVLVARLDEIKPARDLVRNRSRYFFGILDPCALIEFSRGCPWDCPFCSAWTFYGRSYRTFRPEIVVEDLASIREPGIVVVDDVAFLQEKHGFALGEQIARKGIRKKYFLETRVDVLLRNKEVFRLWKKLGLTYLFLGFEAFDEQSFKKHRKRVSLGRNYEALEFTRLLGIQANINIIAEPDWDEDRFRMLREWAMDIPEIVDVSVNTPYPGTENWVSDQRELQTRDYRLFDIKHAVLPTKLPLSVFYRELADTQRTLLRKHTNWRTAPKLFTPLARNLLRGRTNLLRAVVNYEKFINADGMLADHARPVRYELPAPPRQPPHDEAERGTQLYVHAHRARADLNVNNSVRPAPG